MPHYASIMYVDILTFGGKSEPILWVSSCGLVLEYMDIITSDF